MGQLQGLEDKGASGKVSAGCQVVSGGGGQSRKMAEKWVAVWCASEEGEATRKGAEFITHRAGHFPGSRGLLGSPPLSQARIPWNSPAFHWGLLSPAGARPLLPRGMRSASSWGPCPAAWGNPGVSYLPQPSGNPSASCRLGFSLSELQAFLWAPILKSLRS